MSAETLSKRREVLDKNLNLFFTLPLAPQEPCVDFERSRSKVVEHGQTCGEQREASGWGGVRGSDRGEKDESENSLAVSRRDKRAPNITTPCCL